MAEAVGRHRKLYWDQWISFVDLIEAKPLFEDIIDAFLPNRQGQEFMQDDPLIVPADLTLSPLEESLGRLTGVRWVGPEPVDHGIVEAQHCDVKLTDNNVLIVSAVSQDRVIVRVAW